MNSAFKQRIVVLVILLALLWGIEVLDWMMEGRLNQYGIRPRELEGLWGIPLMPFLHGNWEHLAANTLTLLALSWAVMLRGMQAYFEVSFAILLLGGFGTWLIGSPNTVHIGASSLIFGYFGFLILAGLIDFKLMSILSGLIVGFLYGGLMWGLLSTQAGISWAGHISGFLAGLIAALVLVRSGKTKPVHCSC